jgi:LPXTG-motif cell wall-anchored protein
LLLVAGLTLGLIAAGAPAGAQQYPPGAFFITVSDTTVVPGQTITVSGRVTAGATTVSFTFFSVAQSLGGATPAADGTFSSSVTIPTNAEVGSHTLVANDNAGLEVSASLTVVSAGTAGAGAATGAGDLPRTGDDTSIPLARIAALLVAAGGIALFFARRRKSTADVSV